MVIAFRVDASIQIGIGHVMRCITLAELLTEMGHSCFFLCRSFHGNLCALIRSKGFFVFLLKSNKKNEIKKSNSKQSPYDNWLQVDWDVDAEETQVILKNFNVDWLIVDHYGLDYRWEIEVSRFVKKIMVIDDLADRSHLCNLLLDQTFGRVVDSYLELVPNNCEIICGSRYAILRSDFLRLRNLSLRKRNSPSLNKILITMGGADENNISLRVLKTLTKCNLPIDSQITVVLGPTSPWASSLIEQAKLMPWETRVMIGVKNMAELMVESDVAIGAAGSTSWERCCLGLPSIIVILADNQRLISKVLLDAGASLGLDLHEIEDKLPLILPMSLDKMINISCAASLMVDGLGAQRVINKMLRIA